MTLKIFGYGLAEVGQCGANAQGNIRFGARTIDQDGYVFAGMVGRRGSRIASMVGGDDRQIAVFHVLVESRQPGVELFERRCITFDIVAMAIELIEIDQVNVKQSLRRSFHRFKSLGHAVSVVLGLDVLADTASEEDIEDLSDT